MKGRGILDKMKKEIDRLSGGTLFSLMVHALNPRTNSQETSIGKIGGITEETCMRTLLGIMYKPYETFAGNSLKTNLNLYKQCKEGSGRAIHIEDEVLVKTFSDGMQNSYFDLLKNMEKLVSKYIQPGLKEWLIFAILELIYGDTSIDEAEIFHLIDNGKSITKGDIPKEHSYSTASVLLGAWYYVIGNRVDNEVGKDTFERWHKKEKYRKPVFISEIGVHNILNILLVQKKQPLVAEIEVSDANRDKSHLLRYAEYIAGVKGKYSKTKSYLYRSEPRPFYDFYVCNDVQERVNVAGKNGSWYKPNVIKSVTLDDLLKRSSFLILSGTAGIGKSMMMQHILNDAIKKYEITGLIPIFVPLKKYDASYKNLEEYVFSHFGVFDTSLINDDLRLLLSEGRCLVLFDGLDEVGISDANQFELAAESFVDKYDKNVFVISSRPYSFKDSFDRFTTIDILPFNREQVLQLVDRLQFGEDNSELRNEFKNKLKKGMFETHSSLVTNPLLLTLMMMTYEANADVPTKRYLFYNKAYYALAEKHDAKKNTFKRSLSTGLSVDRLREYLAEFSAKTYRDGETEFDKEKLGRYFSKLKRRQEDIEEHKEINLSDFIDDLKSNICIMYEENGIYRFIHNSFQDYFCALYFSQQKDKMLREIGNLFERRMARVSDDQAFAMLYDMIPKHIEEYIFLPVLQELFGEGVPNDEGYEQYLLTMYPSLVYAHGEVPDIVQNRPISFIYSFIVNANGFHEEIGKCGLPHYKNYIQKQYAYIVTENGELELSLLNELPSGYVEKYGMPDADGVLSKVDTRELFSDREGFRELINEIKKPEFPLYKEYLRAIAYMRNINTEEISQDKDLFDFLD